MPESHQYDIRQEPHSNPANLRLGTYAFSNTPAKRSKEEDERYQHERSVDKIFMSYIDEEAVAKVGVIPMSQNVRGKILPMGGITGVASMPVARRGGHIRALMQRSIDAMHEDGQIVSTLYPFKSSYYEMFGYAGFQVPLWARVKPEILASYMRLEKTGAVQQRLSSDAKEDIRSFVDRMYREVHGMGCLPETRINHDAETYPSWFFSVHEDDEITGGLSYRLNVDDGFMTVNLAMWTTLNARIHVLDHLARHVDQVKEIRMPILPGDDPHLWASEDNGIIVLSDIEQAWNAPMGRIITLTGLEGIPVGDGTVAIRVHDEQAPWNDGVWTLTGTGGVLHVRAGGDARGKVAINGLSAMLYSGFDPTWLPLRGWGQVSAETAAELQRLFPPVTPYLDAMF